MKIYISIKPPTNENENITQPKCTILRHYKIRKIAVENDPIKVNIVPTKQTEIII